MKSTDVYKIFDTHLRSDLKSSKYNKAKSSILGYSKKIGAHYLNFWVQCSRDGFDKYVGSKFIIQFSISITAEILYSGLAGGRIPKYFTTEELEKVRLIQNNIIRGLTNPPLSYFPDSTPTDTDKWFLKKFEPVNEPFTSTSDIWFCYKTESDVEEWCRYLKQIILRTLTMLEAKPYE